MRAALSWSFRNFCDKPTPNESHTGEQYLKYGSTNAF